MQFTIKRAVDGGHDVKGYELPPWAALVVLADILLVIPLFIIVRLQNPLSPHHTQLTSGKSV